MSRDPDAFIVTFESSHAAIRGERALKGDPEGIELVPVPREISSACGFCLRVPLPADPGETGAAGGSGAVLETILRSIPLRESLWAAWETDEPGSRRKEKRYERIP